MSMIKVSELTFSYDNHYDNIFESYKFMKYLDIDENTNNKQKSIGK